VVDRKEESSVSNDVIEALLRRLSPRAREVYDQIETLVERPSREGTSPEEVGEQAAALLDGLTVSERTDLMKILEAQMAYVERQGEEARRREEQMRQAAALMQRARELDREEGKPVNDAMTLKEAVERLRTAGKLSEEEERFIERVKDRVVEVPATTEKIEHRELGEYWGETPEGHFYPHSGEHDELIDRLEKYYAYALFTAAAAVYNKTGSLDIAASALGHAGFQPPPGYEVEDENDYYVEKEALPFWIEENRNRIFGLIDSTTAKAIAHGETLE
jgi:hypothetical protein